MSHSLRLAFSSRLGLGGLRPQVLGILCRWEDKREKKTPVLDSLFLVALRSLSKSFAPPLSCVYAAAWWNICVPLRRSPPSLVKPEFSEI